VVTPLFSYQWPVEQKTVIATFGQHFAGNFYRGIAIGGKGQKVRPIDAGEIVFYRENGSSNGTFPSGLGSLVVVQHEKKIRSLYGHLDLAEDVVKDRKTAVTVEDVLGLAGGSGYAEGERLFLMVFDTEINQLVNPFLILPPLVDRTRPTIRNVVVSNKVGIVSLPPEGPIPSGLWNVASEIYDLSGYVRYFCPMAPYRISVFVNGQETFQVTFDALKEKDGIMRIFPSQNLAHENLYTGEGIIQLGTVQLNKGLVNLEIIVRDFFGNESIQSHQFRVN
jgi:hypothetical protein